MAVKVKLFAGPRGYDARRLYHPEDNELRVGIDCGLDAMLAADIPIDLAIGDFDSIDPAHLGRVRAEAAAVVALPADKDWTDLAFALDYVHRHFDCASVVVYGGIGGRVDHLLANINLMKRYDLVFEDRVSRMYSLRQGTHRIDNVRRYVSFFAIENCENLSIQGFRFELDRYFLDTRDSLCISNSGAGEVSFTKGFLLVIETDDPESRD